MEPGTGPERPGTSVRASGSRWLGLGLAAISVEGLTKRFGSLTALEGVELSVPTGTVFGLLGPNGAGKTTAIRILTTILRPTSGRAEVLGHDVVREPAVVRGLIGLAGQYAAVDPNLTGRENLRLIGRLTRLPRSRFRPRADELLERFGLADAGDRTVRTYSGGMRRRLDVAAALVPHPPVLFLDEPTTGLDPASRLALWEMIRELVGTGTTVLLTTQYLEEADRLAGRVAVISAGRVIADDEPTLLKERLGHTVIELRMPDQDRARQATALIARRLPHAPERQDSVVSISSKGSPRLLLDVLHLLDENALTPRGVTVRESSLDDVFLALTGHLAADADADANADAGTGAGGQGGQGGQGAPPSSRAIGGP